MATRKPASPPPAPRVDRWDRDAAITRERLARLTGGPRRMTDEHLAGLMAERKAEDDAEFEARRLADGW